MKRRDLLQLATALGLAGTLRPAAAGAAAAPASALSADALPNLAGDLTAYLGRGEGGLYEKVVEAIRGRNPRLNLQLRRGGSTSLANTLVAEGRAGVKRADLFWSIDSGALGLVVDAGLVRPVPESLLAQLKPTFRYPNWVAVSGRIRTIAYNPGRVRPDRLPRSIMDFADSDLRIGWAPAYGAFQSFLTAMRLLEGEQATRQWLRGVSRHATSFAGELGAVMATARGQVDVAFANHYYTLRLKQGMPDAAVELAFTENDAGCLVNASGAAILTPEALPVDFIRYLLTREVQGYLAREAYEIPLVPGVAMPEGLPPLAQIRPPRLDLTRLADLQPTLALMRDAGVL